MVIDTIFDLIPMLKGRILFFAWTKNRGKWHITLLILPKAILITLHHGN